MIWGDTHSIPANTALLIPGSWLYVNLDILAEVKPEVLEPTPPPGMQAGLQLQSLCTGLWGSAFVATDFLKEQLPGSNEGFLRYLMSIKSTQFMVILLMHQKKTIKIYFLKSSPNSQPVSLKAVWYCQTIYYNSPLCCSNFQTKIWAGQGYITGHSKTLTSSWHFSTDPENPSNHKISPVVHTSRLSLLEVICLWRTWANKQAAAHPNAM